MTHATRIADAELRARVSALSLEHKVRLLSGGLLVAAPGARRWRSLRRLVVSDSSRKPPNSTAETSWRISQAESGSSPASESYVESQLLLGRLHSERDKDPEAARAYRRAITCDPYSGEAHAGLIWLQPTGIESTRAPACRRGWCGSAGCGPTLR